MAGKSIPRKSFEILYKQFALPLTKFIVKRMGGNTQAVEEVFSATMAAGWRGYKTFKHKSSFFTWLCRIALNKMADYYRDQVNRRSQVVVPSLKLLMNAVSPEINPTEKLALEELKIQVNRCLNLLPPDKRRLLHLKYWQELTHREIAKTLGISVRAVEGRLYRARAAMEATLSDNE